MLELGSGSLKSLLAGRSCWGYWRGLATADGFLAFFPEGITAPSVLSVPHLLAREPCGQAATRSVEEEGLKEDQAGDGSSLGKVEEHTTSQRWPSHPCLVGRASLLLLPMSLHPSRGELPLGRRASLLEGKSSFPTSLGCGHSLPCLLGDAQPSQPFPCSLCSLHCSVLCY